LSRYDYSEIGEVQKAFRRIGEIIF